MGLGKAFTRAAAPPAHNRSALADGINIVIDGHRVPAISTAYRGGMRIPGAWRAATLLSNLLGEAPWYAVRQMTGNRTRPVSPAPVLLTQPSPPETLMNTHSSLALDLIWHGNAVAVVAARDDQGNPIAYLPVSAEAVGVRRLNGSEVAPISYGAVVYSIGGYEFLSHDVLHIKGPAAPGGLRGMGVLEAHMKSLNLAEEQLDQASHIADAGVPTGVLNVLDPDATEDELKKYKAQWVEGQRTRSTAVLNTQTEFQAIAWDPEKMEIIEARKFTNVELANIFGLPPSFLGVSGASETYSNVEQDGINLLRFSLGGHLARFEQALTLLMPDRVKAKADLSFLLRGDMLSRFQAYAMAGDWLTADEKRELEDRPPLTDDQLNRQYRVSAAMGKNLTPDQLTTQGRLNAAKPGGTPAGGVATSGAQSTPSREVR